MDHLFLSQTDDVSKIDILSEVWERPSVNILKFTRLKPVGVEH